MSSPLDGYVEVSDRIKAFHEKYPEGSLQGSYEVRELGDDTVLVYRAAAYRTPEDKRPGIGFASEPVPGETNFTRKSELMNAETSAWGRALAALGFEVHSGIASANEVRARTGGTNGAGSSPSGFASDKQKAFFERVLKEAGLGATSAAEVVAYAEDNLSRSAISNVIDEVKEDKAKAADLAAKAKAQLALTSDVPADTTGLD